MNRLTKTTFVALGITVSVGLWSFWNAWTATSGHCWEKASKEQPLKGIIANRGKDDSTPAPQKPETLPHQQTLLSIESKPAGENSFIITETYNEAAEPAPHTRPEPNSYQRAVCPKCGQKYRVLRISDTPLNPDQIKHLHRTPQEKAKLIQSLRQIEKELSNEKFLSEQVRRDMIESLRRDWGLTKEDLAGSETKP